MFYFQTDGQIERQNQIIEQYFRAFCNFKQIDQASLFIIVKFAYNNLVYTSIEITLFQANKARILFRGKGLRETYKGNILKYTEELANKLKTIYNKLRQSLVKA